MNSLRLENAGADEAFMNTGNFSSIHNTGGQAPSANAPRARGRTEQGQRGEGAPNEMDVWREGIAHQLPIRDAGVEKTRAEADHLRAQAEAIRNPEPRRGMTMRNGRVRVRGGGTIQGRGLTGQKGLSGSLPRIATNRSIRPQQQTAAPDHAGAPAMGGGQPPLVDNSGYLAQKRQEAADLASRVRVRPQRQAPPVGLVRRNFPHRNQAQRNF